MKPKILLLDKLQHITAQYGFYTATRIKFPDFSPTLLDYDGKYSLAI